MRTHAPHLDLVLRGGKGLASEAEVEGPRVLFGLAHLLGLTDLDKNIFYMPRLVTYIGEYISKIRLIFT